MPVFHAFTSPQPDVADPTLVRPSDWNSSHLATMVDIVSLGGNTAGALADITGTFFMAGGNNITLSQNANSVTISAGAVGGGNFTAGVSTGGNTSGDTGVVTGRVVLVGGNNVTLSQATAAGGLATVTISAFNQSLQTQSRFNLTLDGNTSGALALISSGVMTLAGGNNITLSQAGNAVTISGAAQSVQPGIQSISAGTTRITTGEVVFSNSNGLSFGADGQTITGSYTQSTHAHSDVFNRISAGTQIAGTQQTVIFSNSNGVSFGMSDSSVVTASYSQSTHAHTDAFNILAAGTQTALTQATVVFSNSNGLTFGMSDSSVITGSYSQSTHAHTDAFNIIAAGTQTAGTQATVVFSNSNGITFGMTNNSIVTASYTQSTHTHSFLSAGMSTGGNTSGTTGLVAERLVFVGGDNITLSQSVNGQSATLTISGAAGGGGMTISRYDNLAAFNGVSSHGTAYFSTATAANTLYVYPLHPNQMGGFPADMTISTLLFNISGSGTSNASTNAFGLTFSFAIYTESNSNTLNLLYSASTAWSTNAAASEMSASYHGPRYLTIHSSLWVNSAGAGTTPVLKAGSRYWGAWHFSTSGQAKLLSVIGGRYAQTLQASGTFGVSAATATSMGFMPFMGQFSATTGAIPATIHNNALNKVTVAAGFIPHVVFENIVSSF